MEKYDVIIVGGGLVGGTLALALQNLSLKIAVIDHEDPKGVLEKPVDGRSYALSRGSYELLNDLGIWTSLEHTPSPIQKIITSDHSSQKSTTFEAREPMGYLVPSLDLRRKILNAVMTRPTITWLAPHEYTDIQIDEACVQVTLDDGRSLTAPLLVGADGRFSALRERMNISTFQKASSQKALVFNVTHTQSHNQTAFEHFTPFGPLALLPLSPHESACVWSLKIEKSDDLLALSSEKLAEELYAWFGDSLGTFTLTSPVWSYPLSLIAPKKLIAPRFVLLGDAAHAFHPVAGQGLNLGFSDVKDFYATMKQAQYTGLDAGSLTILRSYEKMRQVDHWAMMAFCEGMVQAFSNHSVILKHLRGMAIDGVEHMPLIKNTMIRHAMGRRPVL